MDILILSVDQAATANRNNNFLRAVDSQMDQSGVHDQNRLIADQPIDTNPSPTQPVLGGTEQVVSDECLEPPLSDEGDRLSSISSHEGEDLNSNDSIPQESTEIAIDKANEIEEDGIQEDQQDELKNKNQSEPLSGNGKKEPVTIISDPKQTCEPNEAENPGVVGSLPVQWPELRMDVRDRDQMFNGLVRVEAEGGVLVIDALQRCLKSSATVRDDLMIWGFLTIVFCSGCLWYYSLWQIRAKIFVEDKLCFMRIRAKSIVPGTISHHSFFQS